MYIQDKSSWYLERVIYLIAGCMVILSLAFGVFVSEWFLLLTLLVGINLTIFAITGFCPMSIILYKLGIKPKKS